MCGRYVLKAALPDIARMLGMDADIAVDRAIERDWDPSYNIAPTRAVPACRIETPGHKQLALMHWGLIPQWAKKPDASYRMINARAETVAEKPAFRSALRHRRCLIPADGYYEWKSMPGRKQPYYFSMKNSDPFCFAGLWERWQPAEGEAVESCAIITTGANALGAEIHHRMPVIVPAGDYDQWLDPQINQADEVLPLLRPFPPRAMTVYPVSTLVNNARVDESRCITPLADPA
jgi:putative SOS response-associated peptidase YedK